MASESERMTSSNPPRRRRYARFLWLPLLLVLGVYPQPILDVVNPAVEDTMSQVEKTDPKPTDPIVPGAPALAAETHGGNK